MVLRVEYILVISLVILFGFIFMKQPNDIKPIESNSTKELYFKNLSLIGLSEKGVENRLISSSVIKYRDHFEFKDINATYKREHNLLANRAIYRDRLVSMEGNISLQRSDGFSFIADKLLFNIESKLLYAESDFQLDINGSSVSGKNLHYNLEREEVHADFIKAMLTF
jgi:lipopolysaccharide assembly outer membrane protein LptD (OstA)